MSEAVRIVLMDDEIKRDNVVRWIRSQDKHENYRAVPGSAMFALFKNQEIVGAFEIFNLPVMSLVLGVDGNAFTTHRLFELVRAGMDVRQIAPFVAVKDDSPLAEYAEKLMKPAFNSVRFYQYG